MAEVEAADQNLARALPPDERAGAETLMRSMLEIAEQAAITMRKELDGWRYIPMA